MDKKTVLPLIIFLALCYTLWGADSPEERFSSTLYADALIPVFGDEELFGLGFGGNATVEYAVLPFLLPFLSGGIHIVPVHNLESMSLLDVGLGAGFRFQPAERFHLQASLLGGLYLSRWMDYGTSGLFFGVRAEAGYRISPAFTLSLHGSFNDYLSSPDPLLRSFSVGASFSLKFSEIGNKNADVHIETQEVESIFPVFYSYYDDNSFGSLAIRNNEDETADEVHVSLFFPEYMSQPRACGYSKQLKEGENLTVPLYTLFNDEVLKLTENTKAQAIVKVEYNLLGTKREKEVPLQFPMYHRNAMTWDDDRKAAAFVSPTNPAVLWFSRFASGIAENRRRGSINRNLQQGMAIFEALRVYGINYVIDPNSSYIELSEQAETVDYLQFPHQTLFYRGGDCDDISILYCALMESVGIKTAFITIPGHIFMAFSLGISEDEGRNSFYDPSLCIFRNGETWIPVEITLVKEGFIKAWRIGAKQWTDNVKTGKTAFFPMQENWKLYKPVGIPNVTPRFSLPGEVETIKRFDLSMNRYIAREIEPMKERIATQEDISEEERQNKLGILFGRFGMLEEAWDQFSAAAKTNYPQGWTNLGNIAFLQKNYEMALSYYKWAMKLNPRDSIALLGIARSQYELEDLQSSEKTYTELWNMDRELAARFGYLASIIGGEGRAWTFGERLTSTVWAEKEDKKILPSPALPKQNVPEEQDPEEEETLEEEKREPSAEEEEEEEVTLETEETSNQPPVVEKTIPENLELKEKQEEPQQEEPKEDVDPEAEPASEEEPAEESPPDIEDSIPEDMDLKEKEEAAIQEMDDQKETETSIEKSPQEQYETPGEKVPPRKPEGEETKIAPSQYLAQQEPIPESETAEDEIQETQNEPPGPTQFLAQQEPLPPEYLPLDGPQWQLLLENFDNAYPALGEWSLTGDKAVQNDETQMFAKLAVPIEQDKNIIKYSFYGRSTGKGWTGLGLHIYRDEVATHTGYGAGKSILIWVTYDPVHFKDKKTRLQVYRSLNDSNMELIKSTTIPISIGDRNFYEILFNRQDAGISIGVNGEKSLEVTGFSELYEGRFIVFRALDTSEFDSLKLEVLE